MKLVLADDHTLFRDTLVQYIHRAQGDAVVSIAKDFNEALDIIRKDSDQDLVLLDLKMPGMNGLEGLETIRKEFPDTKVALMSGVAEPKDVAQAIDLGAAGYFPKTLSGKALIQAINQVIEGERYIPRDIDTGNFLPSYYADKNSNHDHYSGLHAGSSSGVAENNNEEYGLTPRELDVLVYLAKGESNKEIANRLALQVVTVKLHVRGICQKLGVRNRTQAALKARDLRLVS